MWFSSSTNEIVNLFYGLFGPMYKNFSLHGMLNKIMLLITLSTQLEC